VKGLIWKRAFWPRNGFFTGLTSGYWKIEAQMRLPLFLDEIETMPLPVQRKLCRVLQETHHLSVLQYNAICSRTYPSLQPVRTISLLGEQGKFRKRFILSTKRREPDNFHHSGIALRIFYRSFIIMPETLTSIFSKPFNQPWPRPYLII